MKLFKTPKETLMAVHAAGVAKGSMRFDRIFILGVMAGAYIALGAIAAQMVAGALPPSLASPGLKKLALAAIFPVGLCMVVIAGAELFTGNVMFEMVPALTLNIKWWKFIKNWSLSMLGNFVGGILIAGMFGYGASLFIDEPWRTYVRATADTKCGIVPRQVINGSIFYTVAVLDPATNMTTNVTGHNPRVAHPISWGEMLLRGMLCNWLVCLAVWLAVASEDITSKIISIYACISTFVLAGGEHAPANAYYVPVGIFYGAHCSFWRFLWYNLLPSTLGNIIGGSLFVACVQVWCYGTSDQLPKGPPPHEIWMRRKRAFARVKSKMRRVFHLPPGAPEEIVTETPSPASVTPIVAAAPINTASESPRSAPRLGRSSHPRLAHEDLAAPTSLLADHGPDIEMAPVPHQSSSV